MVENTQAISTIPPHVTFTLISTLIIGLVNLYLTFRQNRKSAFISTVTAERVKWMEKLRGYITDYLTLTEIYDQKNVVEAGEKRSKHLDKIKKLDKKIKLQLNYKGLADKEIIDLVSKVTMATSDLYKKIEFLEKKPKEKLEQFLVSNQSKLEGSLMEAAEFYIKEINNGYYDPNPHLIEKVIDKITHEKVDELIKEENKRLTKEFNNHLSIIKESSDELLIKTQEYMKNEWNRVKEEAEKGNLQKDWLKFSEIRSISDTFRWIKLKSWYNLHVLLKLFILIFLISLIYGVIAYNKEFIGLIKQLTINN